MTHRAFADERRGIAPESQFQAPAVERTHGHHPGLHDDRSDRLGDFDRYRENRKGSRSSPGELSPCTAIGYRYVPLRTLSFLPVYSLMRQYAAGMRPLRFHPERNRAKVDAIGLVAVLPALAPEQRGFYNRHHSETTTQPQEDVNSWKPGACWRSWKSGNPKRQSRAPA
jgi:hypothetical protein